MNIGYVLAAAASGDGWGHMGNGGWSGWMWIWGSMMIIFWVVLIGAVAWMIVRAATSRRDTPAISEQTEHRHAREILADRYARGEITSEEYDERLAKLG
ncbi:SHOCT domain-containing protein [Spirillospora sp. NPDC000708]